MKKIFTLLAVLTCFISVNAANTRLYCKQAQDWWKSDGAVVGAYYWGKGTAPQWPGVRMTLVTGETDLWYVDIDTDQYQNIIFTRLNPDGAIADWGAKTKDLAIPTDGKNLFTITTSSPVWGDPGCEGTWSVYSTSGDNTDPTPKPEPNDTLVYNVTVPAGTYACYIAGEMSGWSQTEMTKVDDTHYTIAIAGATTAMKYKYCSGPAWEYVEKSATGEELADRTYSANDVVAKWLAVYNPNNTSDPNPEPDPNANDTVFFVNTRDWAKVNAYAWTGETFNVAWPGTPAQKAAYKLQNKDVYYYAAPQGKYANVIFNDGTNQTADLVWTSGKYYYDYGWYTRAELESGDIKPVHGSSVPAECEDVMLQAFYYDSYRDGAPGDVLINGKQLGNTKWNVLLKQSGEIGTYFDLVWLPPSGKSEGGTGYHQTQYSNQNSDWGSQKELLEFIHRMHAADTKVVADIVINHAGCKSSWCDFYPQNFGEYGIFQPDASWICNTDEVNYNSEAGEWQGKATGHDDGGYNMQDNYGSARDWAHSDPRVQEMMKAYLKWMKDVIGFDGWRYDYAQGFKGKYIDMYNSASANYFSVVEFWNGDINNIKSYLNDVNWNTLAFDFGTKYSAIQGIADGDYRRCMGSGLLGAGLSKHAVTFVDSHDTYFGCQAGRDNNDEIGGCGKSMEDYNKDRVLGANAFILSMPGVPCVFYPHWVKYKDAIGKMVLARKAAGVHSESKVSDEAGDGYYKSTITGKHGSIRLLLGPKSGFENTPQGYTLAYKGGNFAMYYATTQPEVPVLNITPSTIYKTATYTVEMSAVALGGKPTIYYTLDGSDPTTSTTKQTYTQAFTVEGTVTVKAYATLNGVATEVQEATYTYQEPQQTPLTVKFMPPTTWEKTYLYAWDGANLGKWPGMEWKTTDEEGWLYHVFPSDVREVKIIFNNGAGEQSSDIILDQDACYEWQGMEVLSQNCSLSDIPFQVIANPEGKVYKTNNLSVTLTTVGEKAAATIYYTLDGSDPKGSAKQTYTAPITITGTKTLKAYAVAAGEQTEVVTHTYTYEAPQATPITVGFLKPDEWQKVYLYSWNDGGATLYTGEWPGTELTEVDENGIYHHRFDASVKEVNFIFNDGAGVQTSDLWTDADVCYGWQVDKEVLIECNETDVENVPVETPALDLTQPMYNVLGQKVDANYHGIVLQNGYKYLR